MLIGLSCLSSKSMLVVCKHDLHHISFSSCIEWKLDLLPSWFRILPKAKNSCKSFQMLLSHLDLLGLFFHRHYRSQRQIHNPFSSVIKNTVLHRDRSYSISYTHRGSVKTGNHYLKEKKRKKRAGCRLHLHVMAYSSQDSGKLFKYLYSMFHRK